MTTTLPFTPDIPILDPVDCQTAPQTTRETMPSNSPLKPNFSNPSVTQSDMTDDESNRLLQMIKNSASRTSSDGPLLYSSTTPGFVSSPTSHMPRVSSDRQLITHGMPMINHILSGSPHPYSSPLGHTPHSPMPPYNFDASNDLLRMIHPTKSPKSVPFVPHNAYSVDPITGSMVAPLAQDIIPLGLPINRIPPGMWTCIQQSINLVPQTEDEEVSGLSGFDRVLYTRCEIARRVACEEYNHICKQKGYDLTITMPIQVPYGSIVVDINSAEHYYGIMGESATEPHSDHTLFGRGLPASRTMSHREIEDVEGPMMPDFTASHHPSACDVWASYLNIKLGVIYNVRQDQFRIVCESLKQVMKNLLYDSPMEFTANGIYAKSANGIIKCPPTFSNGLRYFTHLKPKSSVDMDRFIMIRQRLKCFANALGFHFGGTLGSTTFNGATTEYQPLISVELDANLSSERVRNGLIQVEVRSYNSEDISSEIQKDLWVPDPSQPGVYKNRTIAQVMSKVEATEIRLEHDRGHVVDPRWPKDLIITRRITSHDSPSSKDTHSIDRYGRYIFCPFASPQHIVYRGKFRDLEENEEKVFTTDMKLCGKTVKSKLCQTRFKREFSSYLRAEPNAGAATRMEVTMSPVNAPLPKPYHPVTAPVTMPSVSAGRWNVNATEFKPSLGPLKKKYPNKRSPQKGKSRNNQKLMQSPSTPTNQTSLTPSLPSTYPRTATTITTSSTPRTGAVPTKLQSNVSTTPTN